MLKRDAIESHRDVCARRGAKDIDAVCQLLDQDEAAPPVFRANRVMQRMDPVTGVAHTRNKGFIVHCCLYGHELAVIAAASVFDRVGDRLVDGQHDVLCSRQVNGDVIEPLGELVACGGDIAGRSGQDIQMTGAFWTSGAGCLRRVHDVPRWRRVPDVARGKPFADTIPWQLTAFVHTVDSTAAGLMLTA